jgi:hypothetical protein
MTGNTALVVAGIHACRMPYVGLGQTLNDGRATPRAKSGVMLAVARAVPASRLARRWVNNRRVPVLSRSGNMC